tara:strand:- start:124 stop:840 length:717 start_codon:yes stop_codon:yes gene_type:complete
MSLSTTQIEELKFHFGEILKNCEGEFEKGCGSYMFDGKTYLFDEKLLPKQNLLYEKTLNKNKALEIGTYMGHSLLLMLIANPKIEVTTIDIEKKYAEPSVNYLKKSFPHAKIEFIHGNSLKILPKLNEKYDFFHIDGLHKNKTIIKEFNYCKKLYSGDTLEIVFDDIINCEDLKKSIFSTFKVRNYIYGECWSKNMYASIEFPKENKKKFTLNCIFFIKNLTKYVLLKINRLRSFKKL